MQMRSTYNILQLTSDTTTTSYTLSRIFGVDELTDKLKEN